MKQMWFKLDRFTRGNRVWIDGIIDRKPGAYLLRYVGNSGPVKIEKKPDPKGIMYIGSTNNLKKRIHNLIHGVIKKDASLHAAVKTL